jgi:glycosyltransferase involved in cell wall biosynthesis
MGQFARLLPDHGWDVSVLTGAHSARDALDASAAEAAVARATVVPAWSPMSGVVRRGAPVAKQGIGKVARKLARTALVSVLFPDREILWAAAAIRAGRRLLQRTPHDVILATCGPASNLLVGRVLSKMFGVPLVVDFRDLWSTVPMDVFPTRWHRTLAQQFEGHVVRHASRLIAVTPRMASDVASFHGMVPDHAVSITNGFDPALVSRVADRRGPEPRPFRLLYVGSVNIHYDLDPFWRVLQRLANEGLITPTTFRAEFVGNLSSTEPARFGLQDFVDISTFVPHAQVFDVFARGDALFVVETPGYYATYSYAAKVFDYILTGKPVLAMVEDDSNTARLLSAMGVGHCADPRDETRLYEVMKALLALKGHAPNRVDADAEPLRSFNRDHLVARLAETLDAACNAT